MQESRYYRLSEIEDLPLINLSLYRNTVPKNFPEQRYFATQAATAPANTLNHKPNPSRQEQ